jgi:hypothetical protein
MTVSRWLPDLAPGPVGSMAFFIVVGLFSAALSMAGLHTYSVITSSTIRPQTASQTPKSSQTAYETSCWTPAVSWLSPRLFSC